MKLLRLTLLTGLLFSAQQFITTNVFAAVAVLPGIDDLDAPPRPAPLFRTTHHITATMQYAIDNVFVPEQAISAAYVDAQFSPGYHDADVPYDGYCAIHIAAENGNVDIVRQLLNADADASIARTQWNDNPVEKKYAYQLIPADCPAAAVLHQLLDPETWPPVGDHGAHAWQNNHANQ